MFQLRSYFYSIRGAYLYMYICYLQRTSRHAWWRWVVARQNSHSEFGCSCFAFFFVGTFYRRKLPITNKRRHCKTGRKLSSVHVVASQYPDWYNYGNLLKLKLPQCSLIITLNHQSIIHYIFLRHATTALRVQKNTLVDIRTSNYCVSNSVTF